MTIQLPILIWTVICFCVMIFVLDRFLFRPMFAFMDKRNERIENAMKKKADFDRMTEEAERLSAQYTKEQEQSEAALINDSMTKARKDADRIMAEVHRSLTKNLDSNTAMLESESKKIEVTMDESVGELAKVFADALIS